MIDGLEINVSKFAHAERMLVEIGLDLLRIEGISKAPEARAEG